MATSWDSDEASDAEDPNEDDFYACLNLGRQASVEEINNAYRRLSRIYHPDKHTDAQKKQHAELLFGKIKEAYEVLSNPHKRAIYDTLGKRGLETDGWEIVHKTKTPGEIREEYERLAREREERRLQQQTNPKGNVSVTINAADLFDAYDEDLEEDSSMFRLPHVEISNMHISQSIETPLTRKDTLILQGNLSAQNGMGQGVVSAGWRRLYSARGWAEFELGAGNGLIFTAKAFRTLSKRSFVTVSGAFHFREDVVRPAFVVSLARQLDEHSTGYLTYKAGAHGGMTTMVTRDTELTHTAVSFNLSSVNSFTLLSFHRKLEEHKLKLITAVKVGMAGGAFEYGAEKQLSPYTSLSAVMSLGTHNGVTLKMKMIRSNQKYVFPVFLCDEIIPAPIVYGTLVPILGWIAIKALIIDPYEKDKRERDAQRQKDANQTRIAERKREAESAVALMKETVTRIKEQEIQKKGLIIVKAYYGKLNSVESQGDECIDVTIPLQCLVKDSKLVLQENGKSQLPGFYDPCLGEDKELEVHYEYHELPHRVLIQDSDPLRIPKQSHRLSPS